MSAELLTALATSVIAIGIVFAAWQAYAAARQVRLLSYQTQADHERGRRERALDLMRYWNDQRKSSAPALLISPLVEELSEAQCEKLYYGRPLAVEVRFRAVLENYFFSMGFLDRVKLKDENNQILLDEFHARLITQSVTGYLNVLETVACAWRHNIGDRDIIEEEFDQVFFKIGTERFRYETFRRVSGVYPSIRELVETSIRKKARLEDKGKIA